LRSATPSDEIDDLIDTRARFVHPFRDRQRITECTTPVQTYCTREPAHLRLPLPPFAFRPAPPLRVALVFVVPARLRVALRVALPVVLANLLDLALDLFADFFALDEFADTAAVLARPRPVFFALRFLVRKAGAATGGAASGSAARASPTSGM
jgi:hypothetical protein